MSPDAEPRSRPLGAWVFGVGLLSLLGLGVLATPRTVCGKRLFSPSKRAVSVLTSLNAALNEYALRNRGTYPTRLEELVEPDEKGVTFLGMKRLPLDPWKRNYGYSVLEDGSGFSLFTLGADGEAGGTGDDEDRSILAMPRKLVRRGMFDDETGDPPTESP